MTESEAKEFLLRKLSCCYKFDTYLMSPSQLDSVFDFCIAVGKYQQARESAASIDRAFRDAEELLPPKTRIAE